MELISVMQSKFIGKTSISPSSSSNYAGLGSSFFFRFFIYISTSTITIVSGANSSSFYLLFKLTDFCEKLMDNPHPQSKFLYLILIILPIYKNGQAYYGTMQILLIFSVYA